MAHRRRWKQRRERKGREDIASTNNLKVCLQRLESLQIIDIPLIEGGPPFPKVVVSVLELLVRVVDRRLDLIQFVMRSVHAVNVLQEFSPISFEHIVGLHQFAQRLPHIHDILDSWLSPQ